MAYEIQETGQTTPTGEVNQDWIINSNQYMKPNLSGQPVFEGNIIKDDQSSQQIDDKNRLTPLSNSPTAVLPVRFSLSGVIDPSNTQDNTLAQNLWLMRINPTLKKVKGGIIDYLNFAETEGVSPNQNKFIYVIMTNLTMSESPNSNLIKYTISLEQSRGEE